MNVPKYPGLLEEEEEESYETAETMNPQLYRATTKGDILEFVMAMESADMQYNQPASCVQVGPQKNTVLHIATSFGHHEIVKLICKDLSFFVAEKNANGDIALHIAAKAGDSSMVQLLIDSDFKEGGLSEKNAEGNTPLHEALKHGHEEVALMLINKNPHMSYSPNKEGKSLLYLAAEAGFLTTVRLLMDNPVGNYSFGGKMKNKSPVLAAIFGRNIDVLKLLWEKDQSSFQLRSGRGKNPLHFAVCTGYLEGVNFLMNKYYYFAYQKDRQGFYPIHSAAKKGYVDIMVLILHHRPDTRELLNAHGQNIIHVAAKNGNFKAVNFMLKMPELEKLINEKDEDGNTPLHLATIHGHPKVVSILASCGKAALELENSNHQTARDIAEEDMATEVASFQKWMTWMALRVFGAPRARQAKGLKGPNFGLKDQADSESWRDKINVMVLVATVIATVTYTAGFSIPGGFNNNDPDQGIATMLKKLKFQEFVICDMIAMYSSVMVIVTLIWAQLGDPSSTHVALRLALPLLGISLAMMSVAFMAGVYLVVSKLSWLANVVLFMGVNFSIAIVVLFVPLCFLGLSDYRTFRHLSYYPFCLVLYTFGT